VFLTRPYEEWEAVLLAHGVPVGAINDVAQVVEHPQVKARGSLVDVTHKRAGKVRVVGPAARLSRTPASVRGPSPTMGEHTDVVLTEMLGLDAAEVARLRAAGAFGAA